MPDRNHSVSSSSATKGSARLVRSAAVVAAVGATVAVPLLMLFDYAQGHGGLALPLALQLPWIVALVACGLVALRPDTPVRAQWALLCVVIALRMIAAMPLVLDMLQGRMRMVPQVPAYAGVAFVGALSLLIWLGPATSSPARTPIGHRLGFLANVSSLAILAFLVTGFGLLRPVFVVAGMGVVRSLAVSLLSALGFALAVLVTVALLSTRRSRWRGSEVLVAGGVVLFGVTTTYSPLVATTLSWPGGIARWSVALALWSATGWLLALGAVWRLFEDPWAPMRVVYEDRPEVRLVLSGTVTTAALVGIAVCVWEIARLRGSVEATAVLAACAFILAASVAVRYRVVVSRHTELDSLSSRDPLTGLGSQDALRFVLAREVDRGLTLGVPVSLIVLDVDEFRQVNAARGYDAGDSFLMRLAGRFAASVLPDTLVARLGGDEFAFVVPDAASGRARVLASRLQGEFLAFASEEGVELTASLGVASFPEHALDAASVLRNAQAARTWAQVEGRNLIMVFDPRMTAMGLSAEQPADLLDDPQIRSLRALAASVDALTPGRHYRVGTIDLLATAVARNLGLVEEHARRVGLAASLCDVGQVIPSSSRPEGRARGGEASASGVEDHALRSERLLRFAGFEDLAAWVRSHHEHWDGSGRPDGLAGEEIPLESRIIAVCDAYDAMVKGRRRRAALSVAAGIQHIDLGLGSQFDPRVGEALVHVVSQLRARARSV